MSDARISCQCARYLRANVHRFHRMVDGDCIWPPKKYIVAEFHPKHATHRKSRTPARSYQRSSHTADGSCADQYHVSVKNQFFPNWAGDLPFKSALPETQQSYKISREPHAHASCWPSFSENPRQSGICTLTGFVGIEGRQAQMLTSFPPRFFASVRLKRMLLVHTDCSSDPATDVPRQTPLGFKSCRHRVQ